MGARENKFQISCVRFYVVKWEGFEASFLELPRERILRSFSYNLLHL